MSKYDYYEELNDEFQEEIFRKQTNRKKKTRKKKKSYNEVQTEKPYKKPYPKR